MMLHVDFTSDAFFRDPAATIARLRAAVPVVKTRFPIVGKVWITTTYEATARVLKDSATFTLRRDGALAGLSGWMPRSFATFANNMLTMDQPDHARLRGIVDEAFRRRAVLDMEPRIRAIADGLADELSAQGSPADLVARFSELLPRRSSANCSGCRQRTARYSLHGRTGSRPSGTSSACCASSAFWQM